MIESIETSRLTLEPFTEKLLGCGIVGWLNDPEVVRYSDNRHRRHTYETSLAYLQSFADSPNYYWAIRLKQPTQNVIGTITSYIDVTNSVADIGILVGEKGYWRGGYGTEAFAGVINWLFTRRSMRKITAGTMAIHSGMTGIMKKLCMQEEGRKTRYFLVDGREVDMVCATLFAEDWPRVRAQVIGRSNTPE
jgi:RimJ/RimL family protein N-acetyltransferase